MPPTVRSWEAAGWTAPFTGQPGPGWWPTAPPWGGCPTGEARITPGFDLPARWIIHTVGPIWQGGGQGEAGLLAACYRASLALARDYGLRRIAFPAISCGVYGYPPEAAAAIAVRCVRAELGGGTRLEEIRLVAFDATMDKVLRAALAGAAGARLS
ncbi:MAG: macro domain-containing protein [Rhodocyclaceae bacterium]|jgi:O-acetyl-ADP-ribose deacetylase (regulator of RNase III)|nr:macro domain-containing protein [Rhodocyclaceae bacterium]